MEVSVSSLVSPSVYEVHTSVAPQIDVPMKDKNLSAESSINCKLICSESKDAEDFRTSKSTSQTLEMNSNVPMNGLVSTPTNRVDSNTIVIGEHMEGCVVVDLQGNVVMKENSSMQSQSAPYLMNEQVLVQVRNEERGVRAQPSGSADCDHDDIKANQVSISLDTNNRDPSDVCHARRSPSKEHSNSNPSVHIKPGVIFESRLLFHEVSGNDYHPTLTLPEDPQKENLEVKLEKEEAVVQLSKRKSARRARLKWKNLEEDDNVIRKINFLKKRKHYPLSHGEKGKAASDVLIKNSVVDVPVWARHLTSIRMLDSQWIFGIATSKAILNQTLEGHSRTILCDYIKSHPCNFEKRRNAKSQECRIMWQHKWIIFDGIPFTIDSSDDLKCTFGMNYKLKRKENDIVQKSAVEDDFVNDGSDPKVTKGNTADKEKDKPTSKVTSTPKKMYKDVMFTSCPAKITVKVIIKYPGYAVSPFALAKERKVMLKALRADLSQKLAVEKEELYYVTIPLGSMHNHSFTGRSRNIHPSVIAKVKGLVRDGITTPKIIKRLLDTHVQMEHGQDMVTPQLDDRAYYPKVKDIGNLVYNYCKKMGIPSKRKNFIGQPVETNSRKKKRHKRTHSEGDNEGEYCDNGLTDSLPLQASTLQEAVRTFCTDESDKGNVGIGEQECVPDSTVAHNASGEAVSLAEMVRGQLDSLRNLTYSLNEVGSLQDISQSLQDLLNQYATVNHQQSLHGGIGSTAPPTAAFIIHESVIDPLTGGEAPMQATYVPEPNQSSLSVPERDANGVALTGKFRNTQVIENPHLRQFRPPVALQCLTTNVVPALTMSQLPRPSTQISDHGPAHLVTSLPSHSTANPATVSITQPTYQTLAPASHDASAVPVQLSLPPYFYYVQEVAVPETSSSNSTMNAR